MKYKKYTIGLMFALSLLLASCKKQEHYESKNLPIESVFDNISSDEDKENISDKDKDKDTTNKQANKDNKKVEEVKAETNKTNTNEQKEENYILKDVVNMRSTPEKADNVVRQLDVGTEIKILEKNIGSDGKWMKIEYNNEIYYLSMEVLK